MDGIKVEGLKPGDVLYTVTQGDFGRGPRMDKVSVVQVDAMRVRVLGASGQQWWALATEYEATPADAAEVALRRAEDGVRDFEAALQRAQARVAAIRLLAASVA
jgi:hypothetical protein